MSAFLVSDLHINALLQYAARQRDLSFYLQDGVVMRTNDVIDMQEAAHILKEQNLRSLHARYGDRVSAVDSPITYQSHPIISKTAVEILKACDCYDYQACETPGYKDTNACLIVAAIRRAATCNLPGYDSAQWDINK